MAILYPTTAGLVRPSAVDDVPAPAYESLSLADRQDLRAAKPFSYLNVTRSPEEEPPGRWPTVALLLADCRRALDQIIDHDLFDLQHAPAYYGYELVTEHHRQLGLIADLPVSELASQAVRPHEEVKTERARLLAEHLSVVEAQSSPIAVAYRTGTGAAIALHAACARAADLSIDTGDGLVQNVWRLSEEEAQPIVDAIGDQPLYLIDGHHRAAASMERARVAADPTSERILTAVFAADELLLLEYNRWVLDTGERSMATVLADLVERVGLEPCATAYDAHPEHAGELAVYAAGQWHRGRLTALTNEGQAISDALDPVVLQREVLAPILDITDAERDERLQYLPGGRPLETIAEQVDREGGIAFVLAPLDFEMVGMAADAGDVLPPKSTYFEPKVRAGVFLRMIGSRLATPQAATVTDHV